MGRIRDASFAQQRLWFLQQFEPGNPAYNVCSAIRITGELNTNTLVRALQAVVQRHEALHTTFTAVDGQVRSVIDNLDPFDLRVIDLDQLPESDKLDRALRIAAEEGEAPFDLTAGPLIRLKLVRLSVTDHLLALAMHHIIMDGWSIGVLLKDLAAFYEALEANRDPELAPLPIQYSDFAAWQQKSLTAEVLAPDLEYWKRTLSGAPEVLELPADRLRPAMPSYRGRVHNVQIDAELAAGVAELSRTNGVTPFIVLLAAFETLLGRYTGADDFVLGTPMAGRSDVDLEPIVGLFVNTIPLRANLSGDPTFNELMHRVREATLDAHAHQHVPFEKIVEGLRPERSMSYTPLFQTMFILQNTPRTSLDFAGLHLEELAVDSTASKFDITLQIIESDGYYCTWEYSTDLFDDSRIARMAEHFEVLLRGICADPARRVSELPILSSEEWNRVVVEWNATDAEFPDGVCIHEAFQARAARFPQSVAVRSETGTLTFEQLNRESNSLAHYLRRCGVQPGDRVGVALERSADAVIALLAVMKAGASYVPIDPAYPAQRIGFMLKDSRARVVITKEALRNRVPEHSGPTVLMDRDRTMIAAESRLDPRIPVDCHSPAYVIYTSGSTGTPKGVLGTHRASMNRFAWMWKVYPFGEGEVCAHRTSLSFVDSIAEIFGPLLQGVPIFIVGDEAGINPDEFVHHLAAQQISRVVVVPSLLSAILDACQNSGTRLPSLRICFTSGESLPYDLYALFRKRIPHVALVNLYGSSEVAADVTCFDGSTGNPEGFVPIGKPIANARVYLLDRSLNPVPIGVPGEIYVSGVCLASGYLDRPELTAEYFVPNPLRLGETLYRTGDLGRYHQDGNIEFLGRRDRQVKIRGLRIELGEIEAALRAHSSVRDASVMVRTEDPANPMLIAYLAAAAEGQPPVYSELRRYLRARLPEYMVPSAFVTLDALPMTPNGKIDQRALPPFDLARRQTDHSYLAPRNELERKLVEIWADVLKANRIGVLDNFFELGGHSLIAAQVVARIRKYLGVELPLRAVFEEPTVAGLASAVETARAHGAVASAPILTGRSSGVPREELEARLRELSDDEINALLSSVLARQATGSVQTG